MLMVGAARKALRAAFTEGDKGIDGPGRTREGLVDGSSLIAGLDKGVEFVLLVADHVALNVADDCFLSLALLYRPHHGKHVLAASEQAFLLEVEGYEVDSISKVEPLEGLGN